MRLALRSGWWEVGNEVYDPRQGPLPSGYTTAQDYLKATQEVVTTIQRLSSDDQSMPILLRPEFKLVGANGRYHMWNRNISHACTNGLCPFDAVIAHNYIADASICRLFSPQQFSVLMTLPEATAINAATNAARMYPGAKVWVTDYNVMFAEVRPT